jgi:hypothetical protein
VNWWATAAAAQPNLASVGPESIFAEARNEPLKIDLLASSRMLEQIGSTSPRLAVVYLPSLDVILNRVQGDPSARLADSIRALEALENTVSLCLGKGYEVMLAGLPGERQSGNGVIASSAPLRITSAWDIAPTVLDLLGFPASAEMPGRSGSGTTAEPRIASYGRRSPQATPADLDPEYYDSLRSLGYIQ